MEKKPKSSKQSTKASQAEVVKNQKALAQTAAAAPAPSARSEKPSWQSPVRGQR